MLSLYLTNEFKKNLKQIKKRGLDISELDRVVSSLQNQQSLDKKYRDHELSGSLKDFRECHIRPDWLLIYRTETDKLILTLSRTGTHSDLFD